MTYCARLRILFFLTSCLESDLAHSGKICHRVPTVTCLHARPSMWKSGGLHVQVHVQARTLHNLEEKLYTIHMRCVGELALAFLSPLLRLGEKLRSYKTHLLCALAT